MLSLAVVELLVIGVAVAYLSRTTSHTPHGVGTVPVADSAGGPASSQPPAPLASAPSTVGPTARPVRASRPLHLTIPALGISAPVVTSTLTDGALSVPDDVNEVGWWSSGAQPGQAHGTVVVDGHVDSATQGRGQFFTLERAEPGQTVVVSTAHGSLTYVVAARAVYRKSVLPQEIFDQSGRPRLVLVTCGGPFNATTRHYEDNIVVYALPQ